jgi:hypothetical protein
MRDGTDSLPASSRPAAWTPDAGAAQRGPIPWPDGKRFAFTAFDDTDLATVANTRPVYDLLAELGFRTTKSVWPLRAEEDPDETQGSSCEDPEYLQWVRSLQEQGFEIGLHCAACRSSTRDRTRLGLERFRLLFGHDPATYSTHLANTEGMYFGPDRVSGLKRLAFRAAARYRLGHRGGFRGHVEGDPHFWGDLCRQHVKYVRNFVFADINTLRACPEMPYHDPSRPFVNAWFASSEGGDLPDFLRTLAEPNQDRLAEQGGACIMYTHFGNGFCDGRRVDPRFERLMRRLAGLGGWFVPTGTLLDYLLQIKGRHELSFWQRERLEWRWLQHKIRVGRT